MSQKNKGTGTSRRLAPQSRPTVTREFLDFLKIHKKWWLLPVLLLFLVLGALVVFGGTSSAPFLYSLF